MKVDVQKLFDDFSHILQIEAIALGGSRATGRNDEKSDYDVYVYLSDSIDESIRRGIGFCVETIDGMSNFIFTNRFGSPHNPAAINRAIKRIVDAHNAEEEVAAKKEKREPIIIPKFSCHIFRHTFASRFCENETNIKVIQEVMGHADVSTTMNIYAEVNNEVTRTAIENLAKNMDVF